MESEQQQSKAVTEARQSRREQFLADISQDACGGRGLSTLVDATKTLVHKNYSRGAEPYDPKVHPLRLKYLVPKELKRVQGVMVNTEPVFGENKPWNLVVTPESIGIRYHDPDNIGEQIWTDFLVELRAAAIKEGVIDRNVIRLRFDRVMAYGDVSSAGFFKRGPARTPMFEVNYQCDPVRSGAVVLLKLEGDRLTVDHDFEGATSMQFTFLMGEQVSKKVAEPVDTRREKISDFIDTTVADNTILTYSFPSNIEIKDGFPHIGGERWRMQATCFDPTDKKSASIWSSYLGTLRAVARHWDVLSDEDVITLKWTYCPPDDPVKGELVDMTFYTATDGIGGRSEMLNFKYDGSASGAHSKNPVDMTITMSLDRDGKDVISIEHDFDGLQFVRFNLPMPCDELEADPADLLPKKPAAFECHPNLGVVRR